MRLLASLAFPAESAPPCAGLTLLLTDDRAMPGYKAACFGRREQTDVVAQAYEGIPGVVPASAEIVVNAERARQEGEGREGGAARELALYIAHGLDHLAGHTDDTPARRRAMRQRELRWLEACAGLIPGIIEPPSAEPPGSDPAPAAP